MRFPHKAVAVQSINSPDVFRVFDPEATTIGMCIRCGVDLIALKTSSPDTLEARDRERSSPEWRRSHICLLWDYASASFPIGNGTEAAGEPGCFERYFCEMCVGWTTFNNENFDLFTGCRQIATDGRAGHVSNLPFCRAKRLKVSLGGNPFILGVTKSHFKCFTVSSANCRDNNTSQ